LAWQYDDLASGTPRSFAMPLLVAFLALLGLAVPGLFESLYGPGSAERFLALAPSRLVEIPNLTEDVDTVDDLERLEPRLGANTRAAVDSLRSGAR